MRLQLSYELQRAERENRQAITRIRPGFQSGGVRADSRVGCWQ